AVYNALEIHLSNVASGQKTYYINLQQGYKISNVFQQKYGGNVSTQIKNNGAQIQITIAGKTYVHLTCTGLSTARLANDIEQDEEFVEFATRLYPNPSNSGVFMLLLPDYDGFEGNVKLDLIDLQGKQVDSQELPYSSSLKLNYNIFPRGLYMLRVQVNGVQVTRRVTIGS
ncbi:MAG: T9SS type A sorting domain-containing protein, partial [Bacteroidota bacterium]